MWKLKAMKSLKSNSLYVLQLILLPSIFGTLYLGLCKICHVNALVFIKDMKAKVKK